ncbi:MAG: nitronate monooxygenase [Lachnospiraceae bacterium]|nr:nitronate monooxygenase [Lachnospiraceae bacterium]
MKNRVCTALGIEYPVVQGAMAWTSMAPLVAAVSAAGGLGVLGCGFMPGPVIEGQIAAIRSMTDKPFACNIFLDPGDQLEINCSTLEKVPVPAVYLDTLNLLDYDMAARIYDRMKATGAKVVAKVNCLQDGLVAEKAGADVIIAKGVEGGGHKARISGRVLLAELVESITSVPILASGGIYTPRQVAGVFVAGAEGFEMGTAFMTSEECPIHPNVKAKVISAIDDDIVSCGESTGEPSWQVRNALAERMLKIEADYPKAEAAKLIMQVSAGSLAKASRDGEVENEGAVLSGQVCGLITCVKTCRELIAGLCADAEAILQMPHSMGL